MTDFDAMLFDAGGIFVIPDPTVLQPLLSFYGAVTDHDAYVRAHYRGMAVKSAAGSSERHWDEYDRAYVESVGVPQHDVDYAAMVLGKSRNAYTWRWPLAESIEALAALHAKEMPLGVVSNASGQIVDTLLRAQACQAGDGPFTPVRVIIDSHVVGVAKPDPRIFDFALPYFEGIDLARIAYVGDSVTMDIAGARAAGLHPILLDPFDDHVGADFQRVRSLLELL